MSLLTCLAFNYSTWCNVRRKANKIYFERKCFFPIPANLAKKYHISKYPTLKLFRGGQLAKREYRSQRSKDAFVSHIRDNLKDPVIKLEKSEDVMSLDVSQCLTPR